MITRPPVERGIDPGAIVPEARKRFAHVEVCATAEQALERAGALAADGGFVLVTGSLYLVGQVLGLLEPEPVPGPIAG